MKDFFVMYEEQNQKIICRRTGLNPFCAVIPIPGVKPEKTAEKKPRRFVAAAQALR